MRHLLLTLILTCSTTAPLRADHDDVWGQSGHRIIGRVASSQLTPAARAAVRTLLQGESLGSVATWADQIRSQRPETGPWHYVNIPIWDSIFRPATVCPGGNCVIAALDRQLAIVADRNRPRTERAEALKWVVHLVGDMHQPLHVGDRGDRGGNDVKVTYDGKPGNLHAVWDTGLLLDTGVSEEQFVAQFERNIRQRGDLDRLTTGSIVDWAMESHAVSRDVAYPFLPASLELDDRYLAKVRSILEDRMLRASVRLAALLNRALG